MTSSNQLSMDPPIEGSLSYLDKIGRKTPRTIIDVRCTLRSVLRRLRTGVPLWRFWCRLHLDTLCRTSSALTIGQLIPMHSGCPILLNCTTPSLVQE